MTAMIGMDEQVCSSREGDYYYCFRRDGSPGDTNEAGIICSYFNETGLVGVSQGFSYVDGWSKASAVLSSISILISLCATVFVVVFRQSPVILFSQFEMLLLAAVFTTLLNVAILLQVLNTWMVENWLCYTFYGAYYTSAFGLFVVLGLKSWRSYSLMKATLSFKRMMISTRLLFTILIAVELLVITILGIWFSSADMMVTTCTPSGFQCSAAVSFFSGTQFRGGLWESDFLNISLCVVLFCTMVVSFWSRGISSIASETTGTFVSVAAFWFGIFAVITVISDPRVKIFAKETIRNFVVAAYFFVWTCVSTYLLIFYKGRFLHNTTDELRKRFLSSLQKRTISRSTGMSLWARSYPLLRSMRSSADSSAPMKGTGYQSQGTTSAEETHANSYSVSPVEAESPVQSIVRV